MALPQNSAPDNSEPTESVFEERVVLFPVCLSLPKDIFNQILSYVSLRDRLINCCLVNKSWRDGLFPTYLDFAGCLNVLQLPIVCKGDQSDSLSITAALECLLPHYGSSLKGLSLYLDSRFTYLTSNHFSLIISYCPSLQYLKVGGVLNYSTLSDLPGQLGRLTQLSHVSFSNLSYIKFPKNPTFTVIQQISCLTAIWPLKQLTMHCVNLNEACGIAVSATNLTFLCINDCFMNNFQLAQICRISTELCDLRLLSCRELNEFSPIAELKELRRLTLAVNITDKQLIFIAERSPKIEELEVEDCPELKSLNWLKFLHDLKSLKFGKLLITCESPPNSILENLKIKDPSLTEEDLLIIAAKYPRLKCLTV